MQTSHSPIDSSRTCGVLAAVVTRALSPDLEVRVSAGGRGFSEAAPGRR